MAVLSSKAVSAGKLPLPAPADNGALQLTLQTLLKNYANERPPIIPLELCPFAL